MTSLQFTTIEKIMESQHLENVLFFLANGRQIMESFCNLYFLNKYQYKSKYAN